MPVRDWTRVTAGTFHDFHQAWITHLKEALNGGVLPSGYYAMSEQSAAAVIPDVLTLRSGDVQPSETDGGGVSMLAAPPKTKLHFALSENAASRLRQRIVTIRQAPDHRLVSVIEIVSPANKDRPASVRPFVRKVVDLMEAGIHVLLVELFAPGRHDPEGLHGVLWESLTGEGLPREGDGGKPLRLASYLAGEMPEAFVEPISVGDRLHEMPLFLQADRYVNVPLEQTAEAAWRGAPDVWKRLIES